MRVLAADPAQPVADDRMLQKDRSRLDFQDQPRTDFESRQQRALPGPQRPGQHGDAHFRAEMNERHDVEHVMSEIGEVRIGDEKVFARYSRNPAEPLLVQIVLQRSVRRGPIDDRLDGRQKAVLKGPKERMAPYQTVPRNEEAERRVPVLIDEVFQRHRRRMDGVIGVVDALGRGRIDAERVQLQVVLSFLDDGALRQRGRETARKGNHGQLGRSIDRNGNPGVGIRRHGAPESPPGVLPWRSHGFAPERVQPRAQPEAESAIDAVGSRGT